MHSVLFPGRAPWQLNQGYGHGERIFDISFHPFNDDIIISASEDASVRLWQRPEESSGYKQVRAYLGHTAEALRACWSANGLLVASGSADRTVRLWAADPGEQGYTGRQLAVLDGHPEEVYHVEFVDPAGPLPDLSALRRAFVSSQVGGHCVDEAASLPLPPFESHVMVASSESMFIWSLQDGALLQQADAPGTSGSTLRADVVMEGARPAYIFGVSRQPGGSLVATACCDGVVRLWSLRPTGHLEWAGQMVVPGAHMLTCCAFASGGSLLAVCSRDGGFMELDVRTLELMSSRLLPSSPLALAHLPAGCGAAAAAAAEAAGRSSTAASSSNPQEQRALWLVACQDGAVYGYEEGQQGSEPCCVLRPPMGPGVAVLALSVSPGGYAISLGGEPQDNALLPPISIKSSRPAQTVSATSASTLESNSVAASAVSRQQQQQPAQQSSEMSTSAVRSAVAAPARRRGAGAGRVVAGARSLRDPLALFEEGEAGQGTGAADRSYHNKDEGTASISMEQEDGVTNDMAAMSLKELGTQATRGPKSLSLQPAMADSGNSQANGGSVARRQQQQQQDDGREDVCMEDTVLNLIDQHQQAQQRQSSTEPTRSLGGEGTSVQPMGCSPPVGEVNAGVSRGADGSAEAAMDLEVALSGRTRAPLFVYRPH